MRNVSKLRATTSQWATAYPWHFGASVPSTGPVLGIDLLSGGAPFGIDLFEMVRTGIAQNPNAVIAGSPANGKSALVKQLVWWLTGAFGIRFVATDIKGEYTALAAALNVPVLDLHPGGTTKVNPLANTIGRLEFVHALTALCHTLASLHDEQGEVTIDGLVHSTTNAPEFDEATFRSDHRVLVSDLRFSE